MKEGCQANYCQVGKHYTSKQDRLAVKGTEEGDNEWGCCNSNDRGEGDRKGEEGETSAEEVFEDLGVFFFVEVSKGWDKGDGNAVFGKESAKEVRNEEGDRECITGWARSHVGGFDHFADESKDSRSEGEQSQAGTLPEQADWLHSANLSLEGKI